MRVGQMKRVWFCGFIVFCCLPEGATALDDALVGVLAASAVLALFALLAIGCTACYCYRLLEKRRLEKSSGLRRYPEEYSTVSEYANYGYPENWHYTDPYYYRHLGSYRPKVLSAQDIQYTPYPGRQVKTLGDIPSGHPQIDGVNHKAMKKSHKRLSEWLDTNYGETSAAISLEEEEDDVDENELSVEQFMQQKMQQGRDYNDDGEFTIVDYVADDKRRQSSVVNSEMFERKPDPLPPSSMPNLYKTTIGVVQERTSQHIEISRMTDDEDLPASTSSPVLNQHRVDNLSAGPSMASVGFDYQNDTLTRRQRIAHMDSVPYLPPEDYDTYKEFMNERMTPFQ